VKVAAFLALVALALSGSATAQDHHVHHDEHDQTLAGPSAAPEIPTDHAADEVYPREEMDAAREQLTEEHGGARSMKLFFPLAEYQARSGNDGLRWEGEGWYGGDLDRLVGKSRGEVELGDDLETAEIQLVYSRAISPYFDLQIGGRYDPEPDPERGYVTLGFEGLAPYWFQLDGALFISNKGDVLARIEGYYDQIITQRLVLQPRVELNFAAQDVPEHELGAGLSEFELGLRLRYEIWRELGPYVGVEWMRRVGESAGLARRAGDDDDSVAFVAGLRLWF
jgi:copper resistance protein B